MSSMFKKKGGLAFKPKAPVARARPQASTARPTATPATTLELAPIAQSTIEVYSETTTEIEREPEANNETNNEPITQPTQRSDSQVAVEEEAVSEKQKESSVASRQSTGRASHSQQSDTALIYPIPSSAGQTAAQSDEITEPSTTVVETTKGASHTESVSDSRSRRRSIAEPPPQPSSVESTITTINATTTTADETTPSIEDLAVPKPTVSSNESQDTAITAPIEEEAPVTQVPKPAPKKATTRKKTTTARGNISAEGAQDGEAAQSESSRPKKRQKRTTTTTTTRKQDGESRPPSVARKRKTPTPNTNGSRSNSRRARSMTPDDAETQVVDLQKLKMSDLTKDLRIGKKFSRHDELRERERKARLKAKLEKDSEIPSEAGNGSNDNNTTASANDKTSQSQSPDPDGTQSKASKPSTSDTTSTPAPAATSGPQFRIVDGQIIVDQDSLVMDRHARAAAARAGADMETIEENDFTRLITSSSFMNTSKLKGPNIWTDAETELFYRGLRMFGTDFQMISKMFPAKQRRHIKLKFNREERHNPQRIDAAVMGEKTIKMDLDEYRAFTGAEFEPVEDIEAEQRKIQETYEAERQRVADEQAEIMRKKREELFADDDDSGRKKKGKGKKKGRQAISYGLNGEPILQES
ncbi:hypothetical protein E4U21_007370 [Claviceps maximensis]|nr:hypothetical protein E4U21_007370 [Claviceps maximensis]